MKNKTELLKRWRKHELVTLKKMNALVFLVNNLLRRIEKLEHARNRKRK